MARATRTATAASENKTPLIIALVFFVLSTIALGVLAYQFNGENASAKEAEKGAVAKAKTAEDSAVRAKEETLLYKAALGILSDKDKADLAGVRFKPELHKAYQDMRTAIDNTRNKAIGEQNKQFVSGAGFNPDASQFFKWDWANPAEAPTLPAASVLDGAISALASKELTDRRAKDEFDRNQQVMKTYNEKTNEAADQTKKAKDVIASIPGQVKDETDRIRKASEDFRAEYVKDSGIQRLNFQNLSGAKAESDLQVKRQTERIQSMENNLSRLLDRQDDLIDPFQFDKPQGRILRRYSETLVDIDLGDSDKVRPGITFSIFPSDTPVRGMQPRMRTMREADGKMVTKPVPKGKIEVISVAGANIAKCRITDEDSQVRDRILPGDLVYNAIWRKGTSEHVALFGIFDLDGDGKDDTQAMIAGLRRVGVTVDAYFDLSSLKWVGEITSQTTFGVEGWYPTISAADGNKDGKIKISTGIAKARNEVKEKGIKILRPRDFFPRIGYNTKLDISQESINEAAIGISRTFLSADAPDKTPEAK